MLIEYNYVGTTKKNETETNSFVLIQLMPDSTSTGECFISSIDILGLFWPPLMETLGTTGKPTFWKYSVLSSNRVK